MTDPHESTLVTAPTLRDLGVSEFSTYSLIIDARTPHEFDDDHIPGAVNLPVVDDAEFAEVGIAYAKDPHSAYLIGAAYAGRNLAKHIQAQIATHPRDARLLVYCFRGGKRSQVWAEMLRNIGYRTDVVKGGWKAYRAWVRASLSTLAPRFEYRLLYGLTGCGKTRLLQALETQHNQVLDLEGLARHRGSLIGALPGTKQPTQKQFESLLVQKLRSFDPARPVWVEAESKKIGNLQLPDPLFDAMRRGLPLEVSAPLAERVRLLKQDYPNFVDDPEAMVDRLMPLKPLVGGEELERWRFLARQRHVDELFERVLVAHYDPSYIRWHKRNRADAAQAAVAVETTPTSVDALAEVAASLTRDYGARIAPAPVDAT